MAGTPVPAIFCWQMTLDSLYIHLASTDRGALRVGLSMEADDCVSFFKDRFPRARVHRALDPNRSLLRSLTAVLSNAPSGPTAATDVCLTEFQWRVLKAIRRIPFGETRTYGQVAGMVNKPGAARAVGQVMGKNPLPLLFP